MQAIKVELKLNNKEKTLINQHIGFSRFCYNYALSIYSQLNHKKYPGGSSKKVDLIRKVFTNLTKNNPDFAWTKQMSSRVYQNAFRALKTAFSRFWNGLGERPKFKRKKQGSGSFTVDSSSGTVAQTAGKKIKLPTLGIFRTKEAIPNCVSQTYTVSKKGGRYFVAFAVNAERYLPIKSKVEDPLGLDVNLTDGKYCVLSDGTEYSFPKPLKAAKTKLRKLQYRNRNKQATSLLPRLLLPRSPERGNRKKKVFASANAKKYYLKLARLHKRIASQREDYLQKLTTELALKYQHLKVETLNIRGMMANKKLSFHIADASFYRFKTLLQQKVTAAGGIVESVDQWYPSSKLCSRCQVKNKDLKLKDRTFSCQCGFNICRDLNSSINLRQAPAESIVDRVGSIRINACEHSSADTYGLKQEVNTIVVQLSLFDLDNYG